MVSKFATFGCHRVGTSGYTGIGDREWDAFLTLNIYPHEETQYAIHHTDKSGTLNVGVRSGPTTSVALSGVVKPAILRVFCEKRPVSVRRDGIMMKETADWQYQASKKRAIIKSQSSTPQVFEVAF